MPESFSEWSDKIPKPEKTRGAIETGTPYYAAYDAEGKYMGCIYARPDPKMKEKGPIDPNKGSWYFPNINKFSRPVYKLVVYGMALKRKKIIEGAELESYKKKEENANISEGAIIDIEPEFEGKEVEKTVRPENMSQAEFDKRFGEHVSQKGETIVELKSTKAKELVERKIRKSFLFREINIKDFPLDKKKFSDLVERLNKASRYKVINIPRDKFEKILFSKSFQRILKERAKIVADSTIYNVQNLTWMNIFSFVQVIYETIKDDGKNLSNENIENAVKSTLEKFDKFSKRQIFGKGTKLIIFKHEEDSCEFKKDKIAQMHIDAGGDKKDIVTRAQGSLDEKGNSNKEIILNAISNSKGPTTIVFSGHGGKEQWFLNAREGDIDTKNSPFAIHYTELADALIKSDNIENINLVGLCCYSTDFLNNLYKELADKKVEERPVAIASANKEQYASSGGLIQSSRFLDAVYHTAKKGEPIRGEHFLRAEGDIWNWSDPTFFT